MMQSKVSTPMFFPCWPIFIQKGRSVHIL